MKNKEHPQFNELITDHVLGLHAQITKLTEKMQDWQQILQQEVKTVPLMVK